jgi:hypothetical protein
MIMTPRLHKLALTTHITFSVGWLGAVAAFLALALVGLAGKDTQIVRAAYLAMEVTGWFVIVPLCLTSLPSGLIMSLGTRWGLFRHYWVVTKLLITVVATILLLMHMRPVGHLARVVAETTLAHGELAGLRVKLVADAGVALLALLVATALSVYKPKGLTPYGRSKQQNEGDLGPDDSRVKTSGLPRRIYAFAIIVLVLISLFVISHLTGAYYGSHTH